MTRIPTGYVLMGLSALVLCAAGCFGTDDQPELGHVTGTITLNGEPLSGIAVMFQPDNGRPATAVTDKDGKYELRYIRDTMGTKVGHNRVEIAPSEGEDEEEEIIGPNGEPVSPKPGQRARKPRIPARYNVRSELEADVKPGENTFDFDLKT